MQAYGAQAASTGGCICDYQVPRAMLGAMSGPESNTCVRRPCIGYTIDCLTKSRPPTVTVYCLSPHSLRASMRLLHCRRLPGPVLPGLVQPWRAWCALGKSPEDLSEPRSTVTRPQAKYGSGRQKVTPRLLRLVVQALVVRRVYETIGSTRDRLVAVGSIGGT